LCSSFFKAFDPSCLILPIYKQICILPKHGIHDQAYTTRNGINNQPDKEGIVKDAMSWCRVG
jgi:hypothetical protein